MVKNRNVAICIILTLITCGIYGLYWFVCLTNDVNTISKRIDTSGGVALLLTIITCGIYGLYWAYQLGSKLDEAAAIHGEQQNHNAILYLILCLLGFGILTYALAQNEINTYVSKEV